MAMWKNDIFYNKLKVSSLVCESVFYRPKHIKMKPDNCRQLKLQEKMKSLTLFFIISFHVYGY